MRPDVLTGTLELVADVAHDADVPPDPFDADALYRAAMTASVETRKLAGRIANARRAGRWRRRRP